MANSNYSQVTGLIEAGRLNWKSDVILGYLCSGAVFNASDKKLGDVGAQVVSKAPVQGRMVGAGGLYLGYPIFFPQVPPGTYQALIVQDVGMSNINLLAFYDVANESDPLTLDHEGTFVLRPGSAEGFDEQYRVWMRLEE